MQIIYKHGNLLDASEPYLCHGCNMQKTMGSGVAALIRSKYPKAYEDYIATEPRLGLNIWSMVAPNKTIINSITQEFYGRDPNVVYVSYDAVQECMQGINSRVGNDTINGVPINDSPVGVAMPLLGAGLAQGSWKIISQIIEQTSSHFQPVVYLIDGKIPTS